MSQAPKDTRSAAEKTRDTAGIVGSLKHEGYVPTPEAEAIKIFRDRALNQDAELTARQRRPERA
jgi:hypothetical protein